MRGLLAGLLPTLTACGRLGFDELAADDSTPDASPPPPEFVAAGGASADSGVSTLQVTFPATTVGNLLIVPFTIHTGATVTGITDDGGNTYVSAGVRASMNNTTSDLWYAEQTASASKLDVTLDFDGTFNVYTLEVTGVRGAPAKMKSDCLLYPPEFVQAPITTTVPDELIVTVTMFQFPVFVSAMLPPFTGLPPQSGNAAGYLIAREPDTYASTFQIESGQDMSAMTCASSLSWIP